MLSGGFAQRQRRLHRQQQPGRSSLCFPNASCAGLCESAFLQSKRDSGERREAVGARGAWQGGGWGDLVKKGAACELGVVSCRGSAICSL